MWVTLAYHTPMANTHPHRVVDLSNYEYEGPVGHKFKGVTAFVFNHLDSTEAALFSLGEERKLTQEEREVFDAVNVLLDRLPTLAQYL